MGNSSSNRRNMAQNELIGSYNYQGTTFKFCTGNIAEIEGDVVLVSSDKEFSMSFGAARAIGAAGGHDFWIALAEAIEGYNGSGVLTVDTSEVDNLPYEKVLVMPIRNQNRNSMRTLYREALKGLIDCGEEIGVMPMIGCGGFRLDKSHAARELYEAILTFTTFRQLKELKFIDLSSHSMRNLYDACAGLEGLAVPDLASQMPQNPNNGIPNIPPTASSSNEDVQVISARIAPRIPDVIVDGQVPMPNQMLANDVQFVGEIRPKQDDEQQLSSNALARIYSEFDRATFKIDENDTGTEGQHPCSICLNDLKLNNGDKYEGQPLTADPVVKLKLCPHTFHKSCIDNCLKIKKQCPLCLKWYALSFGTQPKDATMRVKRVRGFTAGHPDADGFFKITYTIPSGIQTINHIRPGEPYSGTTRSAFIPNDEEGRLLIRLLNKAFEYRHVFTIGDSITSNAHNVPVWVIHHKTRMNGGPQNYGYPDPDYYQRLRAELEQFGITPELLDS